MDRTLTSERGAGGPGFLISAGSPTLCRTQIEAAPLFAVFEGWEPQNAAQTKGRLSAAFLIPSNSQLVPCDCLLNLRFRSRVAIAISVRLHQRVQGDES